MKTFSIAVLALALAILTPRTAANSMVEVDTGDDFTFVQLFVDPLVPIGDGTTSELSISYATNVVLVGYAFFLTDGMGGNLDPNVQVVSVLPPETMAKPIISNFPGFETGVVFGGTGAFEIPGASSVLDPIVVLPTIMCMTKAECQILVLNDDPEAKQLLAKFEVVTPPTNQVFITGPDGEAKVIGTEPINIFVGTPMPTPMPMPADSMMSVKGDPHFTGLHGQNFDFTGEPGRYYALINDYYLVLNAKFGQAYSTGIHTDVSTMQVRHMHDQGTWITEIGMLIGGHLIFISVESPPSREIICPPIIAAESEAYLKDGYHASEWQTHNEVCFFGGHMLVDGQMVFQLGEFELDSDVSFSVKNSRSFGRIHIVSSSVGEIEVDYVPPPSTWRVPISELPLYSHLNVAIPKILVSDSVHGVLGQTARLKTMNGIPVLEGMDSNGKGIVDGYAEDYELADIYQTNFKFGAYNSI